MRCWWSGPKTPGPTEPVSEKVLGWSGRHPFTGRIWWLSTAVPVSCSNVSPCPCRGLLSLPADVFSWLPGVAFTPGSPECRGKRRGPTVIPWGLPSEMTRLGRAGRRYARLTAGYRVSGRYWPDGVLGAINKPFTSRVNKPFSAAGGNVMMTGPARRFLLGGPVAGAAVLLVGFLAMPAASAQAPGTFTPSSTDSRAGVVLHGDFTNSVGSVVATADGLSFTSNGSTFTEPIFYPEDLWGTYPMYLPGSTVTAVITVSNANLVPGPRGFFRVVVEADTLPANDETTGTEILPVQTYDVAVPKGGEREIPVAFTLPAAASGHLSDLHAALNLNPGTLPTPPGGHGAVPQPFLQINMVFGVP